MRVKLRERVVSWVLSLAMILSLLPMSVFAVSGLSVTITELNPDTGHYTVEVTGGTPNAPTGSYVFALVPNIKAYGGAATPTELIDAGNISETQSQTTANMETALANAALPSGTYVVLGGSTTFDGSGNLTFSGTLNAGSLNNIKQLFPNGLTIHGDTSVTAKEDIVSIPYIAILVTTGGDALGMAVAGSKALETAATALLTGSDINISFADQIGAGSVITTAPIVASGAIPEGNQIPTESPVISESPAPEESQAPTESPETSESPAPEDSQAPTESPETSESPVPEESQAPTESPEVSESPAPEESQTPTENPEAPGTPGPEESLPPDTEESGDPAPEGSGEPVPEPSAPSKEDTGEGGVTLLRLPAWRKQFLYAGVRYKVPVSDTGQRYGPTRDGPAVSTVGPASQTHTVGLGAVRRIYK